MEQPPTDNERFQRWVRSTAFSLTLKESAVHVLLAMLIWEDELRDPTKQLSSGHWPSGQRLSSGHWPSGQRVRDPDEYGYSIYDKAMAGYLDRRGLIRSATKVKADYNYVLTEAGTHTARLLGCAGFRV